VVFMGTPTFAVPTLQALLASRHPVVGVVTGLDKPAGRTLRPQPTAVKKASLTAGLPILQPEKLKNPEFLQALAEWQPDVCVVVAFRILPREVIEIPPRGCINMHPSLLPALRGAAPINWALMNGCERTGITTFLIEKRIDAGSILLQREYPILPEDDAGSLSERLSAEGARLIVETLDGFEEGRLVPRPQAGEPTPAPKIEAETCRIDWTRPATEICNQIRGLSPAPAAFTTLNGKRLKLFRAKVVKGNAVAAPGTVIKGKAGVLTAQCGAGGLAILELQLEGKRRLDSTEFVRGKPVECGTTLV